MRKGFAFPRVATTALSLARLCLARFFSQHSSRCLVEIDELCMPRIRGIASDCKKGGTFGKAEPFRIRRRQSRSLVPEAWTSRVTQIFLKRCKGSNPRPD